MKYNYNISAFVGLILNSFLLFHKGCELEKKSPASASSILKIPIQQNTQKQHDLCKLTDYRFVTESVQEAVGVASLQIGS